MPVITIRGDLGSGAPEIGKLVADRLHIHYVDREIIAAVAAHLHRKKEDVAEKEKPLGSLGEHIDGALERGGAYEGAYLPPWEIPLDDKSYLAGLEFVIRELAHSQSIVIRGRGSQFILKEQPGVLHILIVAPLNIRLIRVMESLKLDEVNAVKEIERYDNSRRELYKRYFHAEMEDLLHYDLVINTEHLSFEEATSIIANTIRSERKTKE